MNLQEQVKWEKEMLSFGIARFRGQDDKAIERGSFTETSAGSRLLRGYLTQVSQHIQHYVTSTNYGKYAKLLRSVDSDKLAMFSLQCIISAIYEEISVVRAVQKIGILVEDELKFSKFYLETPELFDTLQRDLDKRNSNSYRHRHRVLTHMMNKNKVAWTRWSAHQCCGVGELVLRLTLESTDFVERKVITKGLRKVTTLVATPEVHNWITNSNDSIAVMLPDRMPCIIPPCDWTDHKNGGYHTPRLRMSTPLVKTRRGISGDVHKDILDETKMPRVLTAINAMQRTGWTINETVLSVMQTVWDRNLSIGMPNSQPYEIPASPVDKDVKELTPEQELALNNWKQEAREVYMLEQQRRGLVLGIARTMRIGTMLKQKGTFYYVYQCDFRGRVYSATTGVSPQGNDHAKAVLQFADKQPLGPEGLFWLGVHGANKYGYDKVSYADRSTWARKHIDKWRAVLDDPLANRKWWQDADKPYQFLAWCLEYASAHDAPCTEAYLSSLPVALDGSCNGLQHFSAMLRDPIGGGAVNLLPSAKPADIYQEVADVCTAHLRDRVKNATEDSGTASNWLYIFEKLGNGSMSRKLSKTPVMTLPYGSTRQACTSSIFKWYMAQGVDLFPENTTFLHCIWLSNVLWQSISEVVIAARAAMTWIQTCAADMSKEGHPLSYTSMLDFPVFQGSRKQKKTIIDSAVGGTRMRLTLTDDTPELHPKKQRQGSSPNLVHHIDATHMMMCLNEGSAQGITSFAMIHDDFGVHASNVAAWHTIIRNEFVKLHSTNLLGRFKEQQETLFGADLPVLPPIGTLDLDAVQDSKYFFG